MSFHAGQCTIHCDASPGRYESHIRPRWRTRRTPAFRSLAAVRPHQRSGGLQPPFLQHVADVLAVPVYCVPRTWTEKLLRKPLSKRISVSPRMRHFFAQCMRYSANCILFFQQPYRQFPCLQLALQKGHQRLRMRMVVERLVLQPYLAVLTRFGT